MLQILFFISLIGVLVPILGSYMRKVFMGERTLLHPLLKHIESFSYRIASIDPKEEMNWRQYLKSMLVFNLLGFLFLFSIQLIQNILPLNPQHFHSIPWSIALNTAISFTTNTNWQAYTGESTLSYLTQMTGLTVQNFLSASTGMASILVLTRGIRRRVTDMLGNFWVDVVRTIVYILIPLAFLLSLMLVSQGVVQTFSKYLEVKTLEGASQVLPLGPVASQVAIKQIGTNGGGFFNANSSHPFENPNALTNFLELISIILIPAALTYTYGSMIGSKKHGFLLLITMFMIWAGGLSISLYSEHLSNPLFKTSSFEGKEVRFGTLNSILWSTSTTATSNGSVNCMHDSLSPLAGGVALFNIMLGELIFGGVGVGLCSMLMFVLLTVFISGLMVGRTPEYMGKKIEKEEMIWVSIAILIPSSLILIGSGFTTMFHPNTTNQGPHALSEILYAFSSTAGNNGSSFAGFAPRTTIYNIVLSIIMLVGRLSILVPSIAISSLLAKKKIVPFSVGTFSTNNILFLLLLLGIILVIGALTFFPALSLGPIIEHLLMLSGRPS